MLSNLILLILASIVLAKSAAILVHSLSAISSFLKISEFVTAFIVMSFITTLPENWVGISSALNGVPTLSLGNVLGSNVADLTLVISIPIILSGGIYVRSIVGRKDALFAALFAIFPLVLLFDGKLGRLDSLILLILYLIYLLNLANSRGSGPFTNSVHQGRYLIKDIAFFILGITLLLVSGQVVVVSSKNLASFLNISVSLIGLLLVSIGTSLPELVFGLKAVKFHHQGLILGNVLGSVVANSTLVLAVTAFINPIVIQDFSLVLSSGLFLVLTLTLFLFGVYTDKKLSTKEGVILLFVYIFFVITEFGLEIIEAKGGF